MRIRDAVVVALILTAIGSCEAARASAPTGYKFETRKTGIWPFRGEEKVLVPNTMPVRVEVTKPVVTVTEPVQQDFRLQARRQAALRKVVDGRALRDRFVAGIKASNDSMTPEARGALPAGWAERFEKIMITRGYEEYLWEFERDLDATLTVEELEELAASGTFAGPKITKVLGWAHAACLKSGTAAAGQALSEDPKVIEQAQADAHRMAAARAARRLAGMDILSVK